MKYMKAEEVLPQDIVKIIQQYADGIYLYVPRSEENKKSWGENSGSVKKIEARNKEIVAKYINGATIDELTMDFYLSESSIRRIIRIYNKT